MPTSEQVLHWADQIAAEVLESDAAPVISTGISPSGEIHIGNMREVLTGDAIFRALAERRAAVRFNYVADNFDPLRRVYPFLNQADYEPLIGRPLSRIPCPCGAHESYSEHFLGPFVDALGCLKVHVEVERADEMYSSGRMNPYVIQALEQRDLIAEILQELTGKAVDPSWSPFNPLCPRCERITQAKVTGFSASGQTVDYSCACGSQGTVPLAGGGKLVWRIDWPARWMALGVTVEPFGKDHATRGGSYETGVRIVREVFGGRPPHPIPYEWIRLKGRGDMSSSRGNVLGISRMLEVVPPEVLRYLVIRVRPQKTINFDPGLPLLRLMDEVDDATGGGAGARALALSRAGEFQPVGVPFKHLVVVAQAAGFSEEETFETLRRSGYPNVERETVAGRMGYAQRWLDSFAPEDLRFEVQRELPAEAAGLDDDQRQFLARLSERLTPEMEAQQIHELIYELAGGFEASRPAVLFRAIYLSLLGKPRGPRAGFFISVLGSEYCAARFREAAVERS